MKKILLFFVALVAAYCVRAAVEVTSVDVDVTKRLVTVSYTLSGDESKIVLVEFLLDGEKIEEKYYANVCGDVNKLVEPTIGGETRKIYWQQDVCWNDKVGSGKFAARLVVYSKNAPPDYMVYDLVGPTNSIYASIRFYNSTNSLPGGLSDLVYRKEKMVFRRIPAAGIVWKMGSPENELGRSTDADRENQHRVRLSDDYYMAVFETTHGQSKYLFSSTSYYSKLTDNSLQKDGDVSYAQGSTAFYYLKEPETDKAVDHLIIGKLRRHTSIAFDLPTEAQWEFACRAGAGTSLNNNMDIDNASTSKRTRSLGWIYYKTGGPAEDGNEYGPRPVGMKLPNAWGLYDMHGNVAEHCRDAAYRVYPKDGGIYENPLGTDYNSTDKRVLRGGYFSQGADKCRSASRFKESNHGAYKGFGFRLIAPIPLDGAAAQTTQEESGSVVLAGELGEFATSGVESGYWDISARKARTVVISQAKESGSVSYDTRRSTQDEGLLALLYRTFGGFFMFFR